MSASNANSENPEPVSNVGITGIRISGYKSFHKEIKVQISPLTLIAGANSSGKSSLMQPLLLLKQTLEANYDSGALNIKGPNVRFTAAEQLLSWCGGDAATAAIHIGCQTEGECWLDLAFRHGNASTAFELLQQTFRNPPETVKLIPEMDSDQIRNSLPASLSRFWEFLKGILSADPKCRVVQNRCFFELEFFGP